MAPGVRMRKAEAGGDAGPPTDTLRQESDMFCHRRVPDERVDETAHVVILDLSRVFAQRIRSRETGSWIASAMRLG